MSKELTIEDRISILLTTIFDEGVDKYPQNFSKLIQRLNEFYDTNKVDIINYFTKVIMYIPTKGTIYSNALYNFGKVDIINNIFKKLVDVHFGVLQNDQLITFIMENIGKKNENLLKILVRSIFLIYRKSNEYHFLIQSINVIYESNIIDKNDEILRILHTYANSEENLENNVNKFDGFFIKEITDKENANNTNDINMVDASENKFNEVDNIFNELNGINYENIFCPELITRKYSKNKATFLDIYYELFLMNNIDAFKDEPNEGCKYYFFSLPDIYYNIKDKEQNNNTLPYQFLIDNITYASLDLILFPLWTKGDLCYITNFVLFILTQNKQFFKVLISDDKEENIYTKFLKEVVSNIDLLQGLSPFQIDNLIFFLSQIITNVADAKEEILTQIQKLLNNTNNTLLYFTNSFYEKISNIIKKDSLSSEIYFPNKEIAPIKNESIYNSSYFNEISSNVNRKVPFNSFNNKSLFENDEQNEVLYTFIYCILSNKTNSLSKIYDSIELYKDALREIINKNNNSNNQEQENDKMKTVLKVIFDLYGNMPLYFTYIIDLFAFNNLLNNITIINFIFTEKLFQKKENGLISNYYFLINNCVDNCYTMLKKFDDDFQDLARSFSKVDETKRKEMQLKMEFYDNEVEKLKKQKDIICDKILEKFFKMVEISEGLGGSEYKEFIIKVIKDEFILFQTRYKVSEEWNEKIRNLMN